MKKTNVFILFYGVLMISNAFAFNGITVFNDTVLEKNIQSIVFYQTGKINTYPLIDLNNKNTLTLAFDDLNGGYRSFEYKIIHCNFDWQQSSLAPSDFMEGIDRGYIENYTFSSNTYVSFTNYFAVVPNDYVNFLLGGNYAMVVYESGNEENPVLIRRFYVISNKVSINALAKRASLPEFKNTKQEIDIEVNYQFLDVLNPLMDIKVNIQQNKRTDNIKTRLQPLFMRDKVLIYDYQTENLFDASSEWRFFDLRPVKFPGQGVGKIVLDSTFNYYLLTDEDRSYLGYAEWKDINGERVLAGENKAFRLNEIDYGRVYFSLSTPYPKDEEIYIFGAFSDWKLDNRYKMKFDASKNLYKADFFLKQGFYNYYYVIREPETNKIDCVRFQGSHYETENEYLILVYALSRFYNEFEIVGSTVINSRNQ